jgi:hypothetical protein
MGDNPVQGQAGLACHLFLSGDGGAFLNNLSNL